MVRKLGFPADTQILFKTHASSIEAVNTKNSANATNTNTTHAPNALMGSTVTMTTT